MGWEVLQRAEGGRPTSDFLPHFGQLQDKGVHPERRSERSPGKLPGRVLRKEVHESGVPCT